jgi:hypothetical protein
MDQLFALGNVSNRNAILEIAPRYLAIKTGEPLFSGDCDHGLRVYLLVAGMPMTRRS